MIHPPHRTAQRRRDSSPRPLAPVLCIAVLLFAIHAIGGYRLPVVRAQAAAVAQGQPKAPEDAMRRRAAAFLRGRSTPARASAASASTPPAPAKALMQARTQHLALAAGQAASLNTPWTPVGPLQVQTSAYGLVTGRITSVAIDPGDTSGNTVCKITSQYSDLSATGTVSLTVLTGTTTAKRIPLSAAMLLPMLLGPLWLLRRRRPAMLAAMLAVCVCFAMSGCGTARTIADSGSGGSSGGGSTGPVTPTGSYNIVASATAAGVTHTVSLTLVVK